MNWDWILPLLTALPLLFGGTCLLLRSPRTIIRFCAGGTFAAMALSVTVASRIFRHGPILANGNWFMLDALSAFHMVIMALVFSFSAWYSVIYFRHEIADSEISRKVVRQYRRYGSLWFGAQAAMLLVLLSNNLGILWVGVEASTLLTAFLICIHTTPASLEAMWKYLLMCSVGVAVAFTGILLIGAAAAPTGLPGSDILLWTNLRDNARQMDLNLLKAGFLFLVVGYGTKAGLAPMHNWLPDAHSQAPAPVSAMFSGFLLNTALYCILRCLPLVEAATNNSGWGREVLIAFGLLSILVAAVFIIAQRDVKRLLAYSSVEHIGIMALGFGLGGAGAVAACFHMLNHSLAKSLSFFSAGRLGQIYGSHDMRKMSGILRISPAWGMGLLIGLLTLIGVAPFSIFLSEFMILKAAVASGSYGIYIVFLAGLGIVFIGALYLVIGMAWGPLPTEKIAAEKTRTSDTAIVLCLTVILLLLGIWMPAPLKSILKQAADVLGGIQ